MPALFIASITFLCEIIYTIIGGIIMITVTAIALPARTIPPAVVCDMIIDSGFNVSLNIVSLSAIAHALQRAKVKSDTIPSFAIGTTIFQELLNAPGAVNFSGFNQHIRYIPPPFFHNCITSFPSWGSAFSMLLRSFILYFFVRAKTSS